MGQVGGSQTVEVPTAREEAPGAPTAVTPEEILASGLTEAYDICGYTVPEENIARLLDLVRLWDFGWTVKEIPHWREVMLLRNPILGDVVRTCEGLNVECYGYGSTFAALLQREGEPCSPGPFPYPLVSCDWIGTNEIPRACNFLRVYFSFGRLRGLLPDGDFMLDLSGDDPRAGEFLSQLEECLGSEYRLEFIREECRSKIVVWRGLHKITDIRLFRDNLEKNRGIRDMIGNPSPESEDSDIPAIAEYLEDEGDDWFVWLMMRPNGFAGALGFWKIRECPPVSRHRIYNLQTLLELVSTGKKEGLIYAMDIYERLMLTPYRRLKFRAEILLDVDLEENLLAESRQAEERIDAEAARHGDAELYGRWVAVKQKIKDKALSFILRAFMVMPIYTLRDLDEHNSLWSTLVDESVPLNFRELLRLRRTDVEQDVPLGEDMARTALTFCGWSLYRIPLDINCYLACILYYCGANEAFARSALESLYWPEDGDVLRLQGYNLGAGSVFGRELNHDTVVQLLARLRLATKQWYGCLSDNCLSLNAPLAFQNSFLTRQVFNAMVHQEQAEAAMNIAIDELNRATKVKSMEQIIKDL